VIMPRTGAVAAFGDRLLDKMVQRSRGSILRGSRLIHIASFVVIFGLAIGSYFVASELWKDRAAVFATVGGFLTLYGVIFAIVETLRARAASEMASAAANSSRHQTMMIFNIKNIAECQSCIRDTLSDLDKVGWVSTASLSRIIELYTAEFHHEYQDTSSPQREAIASLQSHASSAVGPLKSRPLSRLRQTLIQMLTDLTALASKKLVETP
jgi:hypothetical protein